MDDDAVPPDIREVDPLHQLSVQIRAGSAPTSLEIEHALEVGFGRLMGLEADLARARKLGAQPGAASAVGDLLHQIEVLRDALLELRTLTSPPGPPRIGYGFVLPDRNPAGQMRPSRRTPGRSRRS